MDSLPAVTLRGTQDGVLLRIDGTMSFPEIKRQLEDHMRSSESFFRGAELLLEISEGSLTGQQLVDLEDLVSERCGATLAGTVSPRQDDPCLVSLPLAINRTGCTRGRRVPLTRERIAALLVRGTIRSGQRIRHHGHLIMVGDVNPGGEVVAAADIVVLGRLRGMAHAGATGRRDALIAAHVLQPTQLRIAEFVTRSPDGVCAPAGVPEVARVDGERVVIETYHAYLENRATPDTWTVNSADGRDGSWVSP